MPSAGADFGGLIRETNPPVPSEEIACDARSHPGNEADYTQNRFPWATGGARNLASKLLRPQPRPLTRDISVVGTGVDPVTSRFSGARSTN